MLPSDYALIALLASLASCVFFCVILLDSLPRYASCLAAGAIAGAAISLSPAHESLSRISRMVAVDAAAWWAPPIVGGVLALALAAIVDLLLGSNLPVLRNLRVHGQTNLTPSLWGSSEEIALRTGKDAGLLRLLGFGVERPVVGVLELLARIKVAIAALSGTSIGLFFAFGLPDKILHNVTWQNAAINAIATVLVTFFLAPLHEQAAQLAGGHAAPESQPAQVSGHRKTQDLVLYTLLKLLIVFILLFCLQALHEPITELIKALDASQWIALFELCILPVIVTSYFLVAALPRDDLDDRRWDRALGACVWAGSIVLLPFALVVIAKEFGSMLGALSGDLWHAAVFLIVVTSFILVISVACAVALAFVFYGIVSVSLGVALSEANRSNARWRACVAILLAGTVLQAIVATLTYIGAIPDLAEGVDRSVYYYLPSLLVLGWSAGLFVSGFEKRFVPSAVTIKKPEAAGTI